MKRVSALNGAARTVLRRTVWGALLAIGALAAPAQAQIIDENSDFRIDVRHPAEVGVELFTDLRYASNALQTSNLPDGMDEDGVSSTIWTKGVAGYVEKPLSKSVSAYAAVVGYHVNYFDISELNYVGLLGTGGVSIAPTGASEIHVGGRCLTEMSEDNLKSYYSYCGPTAGARLRIGAARKLRLQLRVDGLMALGKAERFARYSMVSAAARLEVGKAVQFSIEPSATLLDFKTPDFVPADLDLKRTDYVGAVEVALSYRSKRVEVGVSVQPVVRWSTLEQYRNWDLRAGPSLRLRF